MNLRILTLAASLAAVLTGCSDNSSTTTSTEVTPPPAPLPPPAVTAKPAAVAETAPKPPEAPKTVAQEAAKVAQQVAGDVAAAAQKQFTDTVADVKRLIAEGKGSEALAKAQSAFSSMKLSSDQQSVVDGLIKQIQEAATKQGLEKGVDAASKAVGDLFKAKPKN